MIVIAGSLWGENKLRSGALSCRSCAGTLRPYGHARTRTVRGLGTAMLTARPRRARCADCRATQVLLPAEMTCRRADSTEVIGHALAAKAAGAGFRTIATRLGRPPSTVRARLRRAPERHAAWLHGQGLHHCRRLDVELLVRAAPQPTLLGRALNPGRQRRRDPDPARVRQWRGRRAGRQRQQPAVGLLAGVAVPVAPPRAAVRGG